MARVFSAAVGMAVLAVVVLFASSAEAQMWIADPSGAFSVPGPGAGFQRYNPPVVRQQEQGLYYWCANCGRYHYRQGDSHTTYYSALDPNRGYVDPGSMQYSTRWVRTPQGWVRQQVQEWRSLGVPHGNGLRQNPDGSFSGVAYAPPGPR